MLCLLLGRSPSAQADDDTRLFEVFVNGRATQLQAEFVQQGQRLSALPEDLKALGLRTEGLHADGSGHIALDAIPGVTWEVDARRQELHVTAPDAALIATQVASGATPVAAGLQPDPSFVANYDLLGTEAGKRTSASGVLDTRLSTPWGIAASDLLAQAGLPSKSLTRLDTSLSTINPDTMRRWQAGDLITGGLAWTRPFRMGGLQVASDFSPRPDLVTFPVPVIGGHADVPSTVDLLVNSVHELSQPVDQGPFQLRQPPVVTGAGDVAVVVRDVTGREQVQNLNLYTSPSLLLPGLASYSVETGWVRQDYALPDDRYAQAAVSASMRYGLSSWATVEGHAEASGRVVMGGAGATVNLWNLGTGTAALAASNPMPAAAGTRGGGGGGLVSAGVERTSRGLSIAVSTTRATRGFQDVATTGQDRVPKAVNRVSIGFPLWTAGVLHLSYAGVSGRSGLSGPVTSAYAEPVAGNAQIVAATYSRPITERMQLYVNGYRDFTLGHGGTGVVVGITALLGSRSAAAAETGLTQGKPSASVEAGQTATVPGEIGWRAQVSRDPTDRQNGQVSYVAPFATASAEVDRVGGQTGVRGELSGALVATPYGAFASNRIDDSYAIVDSGGIGNVGVLQENRPIGRTGQDGLLLIPNLRGWQSNRIALDPVDLPADVSVDQLSRTVRLPARSGGRIAFGSRRGASALIRLVDGTGKPLPAGSVVTLPGGNHVPVGYDGEVYLTDLQASNDLRVQMTQGQCRAEFAFTPRSGTLPVVGPVACSPVERP